MKHGDMTFRQIAEICDRENYKCSNCPFYIDGFTLNCSLFMHIPSSQDLDMEVNINAES